ncbi:hypothetical protein ACFCX0_48230 [Streptomyces sp. NPDC056352]|uniref:hypothetical protein n=1 Tax=unclassified Streptomyces TaxID=2593676 RepID=UPI0035DDCD9A
MFALFFLRFAEDTPLGTAALLLGLFVGRLSVRGEQRVAAQSAGPCGGRPVEGPDHACTVRPGM